ncbi:hypothetical protein ElyMa_002395700 [Elysia marginata]|uniref:Uncharacterized protein n=1 Tax=Elysia marginata TaxID=1093978 RepID=A0AAV4GGU0_9GAST|nr:hypothetical protein ElyMa_002395700 [Elysia marginata]
MNIRTRQVNITNNKHETLKYGRKEEKAKMRVFPLELSPGVYATPDSYPSVPLPDRRVDTTADMRGPDKKKKKKKKKKKEKKKKKKKKKKKEEEEEIPKVKK